ncbi:MAG: hypothetical protein FJX99_03675 [Bacteroidetes bacterium]|nr:hypothetical protein [Bacteroidota bacterium]
MGNIHTCRNPFEVVRGSKTIDCILQICR